MWTPKTNTSENFTLWVTHECNLQCEFCRDSSNKVVKGFMSLKDVSSNLNQARARGIKTVLIGGGEPTLHPNIIEIAKMVKDAGFYTVITTNYTYPDIIKSLDGICDTINISLYDGVNAEVIPSQVEFRSILCLKVLLYKDRFKTKSEFDKFIDKYLQLIPNMVFCCMRGHTVWCKEYKEIDWLQELELDSVGDTDRGNPYWVYRGCVIDRKDLSVFKKAHMMADIRGLLYDETGQKLVSG